MNGLYDEFRIALHSVWKRRWLALAVTWAVCLLGWLVVSMIPNTYESEARVFVQTQSLLSEKADIPLQETKNNLERVQRTLTSTVNLEKVVRGTDLSQLATNNRQVTDMATGLRENIKVLAQQENLFQISAKANLSNLSDGENAKLSRAIVQKLIDIFIEDNLNGSRVGTTEAERFLNDQIGRLEIQLQEAEGKRVAFEQKYIGLLPGAGSIDQRMAVSRQELSSVESNLISAQSSLSSINGQLASTSPTITGPSIPVPVGGGNRGSSWAGRVAQLQSQISEAQSRGWTDSHPDMVALRSQLARAQAQASAEGGGGDGIRMMPGTSSPNPYYTTLRTMQAEKQATVSAMSARKSQLQSEMAQISARQVDEPGVAAEQSRINRDYEVVKTQYDKLVSDREQIRLRTSAQGETESVKFRVIDPPSSPRKPSAPDRPLLLTMVLIAGILAGIGAAFAMSQVQTSFVTATSLEKASGLPVIGAISEVTSSAQTILRKQKLKYFYGCGGALAAAYGVLLVIEMIQRGGVA